MIQMYQVNVNAEARSQAGRERCVVKIRVLIVDDSPAVRDGLASILWANYDMEVVGEAENGVEAVVRAEQLEPDVILMDAQMPEMDGIEATRQIKERFPDIKVLVLTVHAGYADEALAAGADGYLLKDSARQELLQAIRQLGRLGQG